MTQAERLDQVAKYFKPQSLTYNIAERLLNGDSEKTIQQHYHWVNPQHMSLLLKQATQKLESINATDKTAACG